MKLWGQRVGTGWLAWGGFALLCLIYYGTVHIVRAQAPTPITNCRTFDTPGTYVLNSNLTINLAGLPFEGKCFRFTTDNVTIDGQGHTLTLNNGELMNITTSDSQNHITIQNLITNGGMYIRGSNTSYFTLKNSTTGGVTLAGSDNATIQDNTITGGISTGDHQGDVSIGHTILRNTVTGTGDKVGYFDGGSTHPCPRANLVIRDNTFTNTGNVTGTIVSAFRVVCATHTIATGNTVRSTGTGIGFYMRDESDDGFYENNTFWSSNNEAIRIAAGNTTGPNPKSKPARNVFNNNFFRSDDSPSPLIGVVYFQGIGSSNVFRNNTFVGKYGGMVNVVGNDGGTLYDHNTFYMTAANGVTFSYSYTQDNVADADHWTNNIFSYSGSNIFNFDHFSFSLYTGNHNLFYNRNGPVSFSPYGNTLATWRANSGNQDDMNSLEANPLFTNPANRDFTLQAGSPARGAGSGGTDIGARPSGTGPPPTCSELWTCGAWSACSTSTQSRTCTDANSCGTTSSRPLLTQSCDSEAPTITLTEPIPNAMVSGTLSIMATAVDNIGVVGVRFFLDGNALGNELTAAPYRLSWDSTTTTNGPHVLTSTARDAAGNTTTSVAITVTVAGSETNPTLPAGPAASTTPDDIVSFPVLTNPIACNDISCVVIQVIRFILGSLAITATTMFVWGGIILLTSSGDAHRVKKAREILFWATIGIIVILGSWVLVQAIVKGLLQATA